MASLPVLQELQYIGKDRANHCKTMYVIEQMHAAETQKGSLSRAIRTVFLEVTHEPDLKGLSTRLSSGKIKEKGHSGWEKQQCKGPREAKNICLEKGGSQATYSSEERKLVY